MIRSRQGSALTGVVNLEASNLRKQIEEVFIISAPS